MACLLVHVWHRWNYIYSPLLFFWHTFFPPTIIKKRQKYAADKNIFLDFGNKQVSMWKPSKQLFWRVGTPMLPICVLNKDRIYKKCNNIFNIILGYLTWEQNVSQNLRCTRKTKEISFLFQILERYNKYMVELNW